MKFHDAGKLRIALIVLHDVLTRMGDATDLSPGDAATVAAVAAMLDGAASD